MDTQQRYTWTIDRNGEPMAVIRPVKGTDLYADWEIENYMRAATQSQGGRSHVAVPSVSWVERFMLSPQRRQAAVPSLYDDIMHEGGNS